ncbi:MAG: DUF3179 domain-containing protein [Trueperaceae bacterium]|nr:DUF3179 domain-containing protein [Trueperaceae bacterium]
MIFALSVALFGHAGAQPRALDTLGVDTEQATIPVDEIMSGGPPPQGIPALGFTGDRAGAARPSPAPSFVDQDVASDWLAPQEPVILLDVGGEARIYPLQILTWHEIVNDTVAGVPVAVTFCPLCNSALAFDRRVPVSEEQVDAVRALDGDATFTEFPGDLAERYMAQTRRDTAPEQGLEVTFGVSGLLYASNLLMFDTASSTLWSQAIGEGTVGTLAGTDLVRYPAPIVSFEDARQAHPGASVLSRDTGFQRAYGSNPYVGYDDVGSPAFLFRGETDGRLEAKARVVTFELGGEPVAYPFEVLQEVRVVNDEVGGVPVVVVWQPGTRSALDARQIAQSEDVGAVNVFRRTVDGRTATFAWDGDAVVDEATGSAWDLFGRAVAGELAGHTLEAVPHENTLWFAWAAFEPETRIFER